MMLYRKMQAENGTLELPEKRVNDKHKKEELK